MYGRYERLTRQELYDLVWSIPTSKLSERFQLSGRGLGKLCERYNIPVPERGWWAKKAAGHEVDVPPLSSAKNSYLETVEIYVRDDFRKWIAEEELARFEAHLTEEASTPPPVVSEVDDSRHPLIVRSRRPSARAGTSALRFEINVSDSLRDRALRLATAIVNACESRGYQFVQRPQADTGIAAVEVFGQPIGLAIEEPPRNVPHVLTKVEAREKAVGRGWTIPEYDHVPGGELVILVHHDADSERRSFAATKEREIEAALPDLMKALVRIAMKLRAQANYHAEQERRRREVAEQQRLEEARRHEEALRIAAEGRKRRELLREATRLRQANSLRDLIHAVEERARNEQVDEAALREWLAFVRRVAESLDPLTRVLKPLLKAP
jgi:hypothetical protein